MVSFAEARSAAPPVEALREVDGLTFEDLLAPIGRETFLNEYWEKKPLVTSGLRRKSFEALFSLSDIDRYICYVRPRPGRIDMVTDAGFVRDNYLDANQCADINLVYKNYLAGSSLVMSGLQETWEPLAKFSRKLERELSHPVAIVAYLTPPNAHGIQPHFDTQENLLLQVHGTKHWKVYPEIRQLPKVEGAYTLVPKAALPAPILEVTLHPGDVLYVPRGFAHEAVAGDEPSLHITIDVLVRTWQDLLVDAVEAMAEREPALRRSLPVGFLNDTARSQQVTSAFAGFVQRLSENIQSEDAVRKHVEKLFVKQPPPPDGHFAALHAEVELDTPLVKRDFVHTRMMPERDGSVGLQFSGNHISGPSKIGAALRFIEHAGTFTAEGLPGSLSSREKLVLARRLVRIGLLTCADGKVAAAREE